MLRSLRVETLDTSSMFGSSPTVHQLAAIQHTLAAHTLMLAAIQDSLRNIEAQEKKLATTLDTVQADVAAEDTVVDSAITLLQGLAAALAAAGTDPAKLQALHSDITNKTQALANAVVANTPAASSGGATGAPGGPTGAPAGTT